MENYTLKPGKTFNKIVEQLLVSPVYAPFVGALQRSEKEIKTEMIKRIQTYWNTLEEVSQDLKACIKSVPVEDTVSDSIYYNTLSTQASHRRCIAAEKDILEFIVKQGLDCLKKEHKYALKAMFEIIQTQRRLPNVYEYQDACFQENNQKLKPEALKLTVQQIIGYLSFIKTLVEPFMLQPASTENKTQAKALTDEIDKVFGKMHQVESENIHRRIEVETFEASVFDLEDQYTESISKPREPLPGHHPDCWFARETDEEYNMLLASNKLRFALQLEYSAYEKLFIDYLTLFDTENPIEHSIQRGLKYWQDNLPRILARTVVIDNYSSIISKSTKKITIYRLIGKEEYQSLKKEHYLCQGENSFEREKWFYYKAGSPGVNHPYICEITLKEGGFEHLISHIQPDHQYAAIVKKELEPNCFGIHEDLLPFINQLVEKIVIKKNNKPILTIDKVRNDFETNFLFFKMPDNIVNVPYLNLFRELDDIDPNNILSQPTYMLPEYFSTAERFLSSSIPINSNSLNESFNNSEKESEVINIHEIMIPADGDCLYTSIFLGYLLLAIHDENEFNLRLFKLTEIIEDDKRKKLREFIINNYDIPNKLNEDYFKEHVLFFKKRMRVDNNLWGGAEETKKIVNTLEVPILVMIENKKYESTEEYTVIDEYNFHENSTKYEIEPILILQTTAYLKEAVKDDDDLALKITRENSLKNQPGHHYRLMVTQSRLAQISSFSTSSNTPENFNNLSLASSLLNNSLFNRKSSNYQSKYAEAFHMNFSSDDNLFYIAPEINSLAHLSYQFSDHSLQSILKHATRNNTCIKHNLDDKGDVLYVAFDNINDAKGCLIQLETALEEKKTEVSQNQTYRF